MMREVRSYAACDEFIEDFMNTYRSPGIKKPLIRMAFGKRYEIVEYNNFYKVTANDKTKRINCLYFVGEFIHQQNFDFRYIYVPPKEKRGRPPLTPEAVLRKMCEKVKRTVKRKFIPSKAA